MRHRLITRASLLATLSRRRRRRLRRRRGLLWWWRRRGIDVHVIVVFRLRCAGGDRRCDQPRGIAERHRRLRRLFDDLVKVFVVFGVGGSNKAGGGGGGIARGSDSRLASQLRHVSAAAKLLAAE